MGTLPTVLSNRKSPKTWDSPEGSDDPTGSQSETLLHPSEYKHPGAFWRSPCPAASGVAKLVPVSPLSLCSLVALPDSLIPQGDTHSSLNVRVLTQLRGTQKVWGGRIHTGPRGDHCPPPYQEEPPSALKPGTISLKLPSPQIHDKKSLLPSVPQFQRCLLMHIRMREARLPPFH